MFSELKKTVVISIIDFIHFTNDDRLHRIVAPMDIETTEMYDTLVMSLSCGHRFLACPHFRNTISDSSKAPELDYFIDF